MEQNSSAWMEWRRQGIGASDAPIIMGVSPYTTRYGLWLEKSGLAPAREEPNFIQEKGHEAEKRARAAYEAQHGFVTMAPTLCVLESLPFIRASLDGWDGKTVLEIKLASKDDHKGILEGRVPDRYWPQVQHQLMVTGAEEVHYWSWWGENFENMKGEKVVVRPDREYCLRLLREEVRFHEMVLTGRPPAKVKADYRGVNRKTPNELARKYLALRRQADAALKELLACPELAKGDRVRCQGVFIDKAPRVGAVDRDRLYQLADFESEDAPPPEAMEVRIDEAADPGSNP